jgi:hypothetical protein
VRARTVCYPIRVPQNVQQSSVHPLRNESFWTIVTSVLRSEGIGGLYNGIVPQLTQGVRTHALSPRQQRPVYPGARLTSGPI